MSEGIEIRAPLEQTEGTRSQVLRWLKRAGDHVSQHEPLLEIETDKVARTSCSLRTLNCWRRALRMPAPT